jgi:hypothetical protein
MWNNIYTYLIILILIITLNNIKIDLIYLSIMGVLGLFFAFMGFYSLHQELTNNYNIILFNPALLLLILFQITKNKKWIVNLSLLNLGFVIVYLTVLINKPHLLIILPLVITNSFILVRIGIKSRKKI